MLNTNFPIPTMTPGEVEKMLKEIDESSTGIEKEPYEDDGYIMQRMVGTLVTGVYVSDNGEEFAFSTIDKRVFIFSLEGACCSYSWVSDLFGFSYLIGGKVETVTPIDLESCGYSVADGRTRQEVDQVYGYKIRTDKGIAVFSFRNSSNGNYGGWISGIREESQIPENLKRIQPAEGLDFWQAD